MLLQESKDSPGTGTVIITGGIDTALALSLLPAIRKGQKSLKWLLIETNDKNCVIVQVSRKCYK